MKFSIVIPTYNGSLFIEKAIQSAINQTRQADEIIISDDNSSDNTLDICNKYKDFIKIYKNKNGPSGFVNGWNKAIAHATGDYISILHQDDLLAPTFLEEAENALTMYPNVKHLFVPCSYIDGDGKIINEPNYCDGSIRIYSGIEYVDAYQNIGSPHIHRCPGVITHKDIFNVCKYREEAGHIADDDFFYRVGQYTDVIGILKPLSYYRIHKESETGHLSNLLLTRRLANDYLFQLNFWSKNKFLTKESYKYFIDAEKRNLFYFLYYAYKAKEHNYIQEALTKIKNLEHIGYKFNIRRKIFILYISLMER